MLKTRIDEVLKSGRVGANAIAGRVRTGLAGRSRQVVALGTLAAVAGIGLAAATLDNSPTPALTATAAEAEQQRRNAAEQADRATRETPGAPASTTPEAQAQAVTPPATSAAATLAAPPAPAKAAPPKFAHPMAAGKISSCYGPRWGTMHAGIDLHTDGGEPIVAVQSGRVVSDGWAYSGYGISVTVDHGNGYLTHYAHMSSDAVSVGQQVAAGTVLGYEGSTGDSTGPHLHFEVHQGMWNQVNPTPWLRERGINVSC